VRVVAVASSTLVDQAQQKRFVDAPFSHAGMGMSRDDDGAIESRAEHALHSPTRPD
jgi:hypothetical protein